MKKSKTALQGYLLIAPLLLGCLLFYAIPFVLVIQYSLSTGSGGASSFIGLLNYQDVTSNRMFTLAFGNTMRFLAAALPLIMVLAYAIALLMQKHADKHKLLKSVFLFPYIMPVVGAVILVELLFTDSGLVPSLASALGLPLVDWLGGPAAFGVVLLLYLWKNTGYSVILLLAGLVTIPEEQYSAADLDGASGWQKFYYITTPQMWYSVFFAIIFSLINAFKCFREIFLIGGTHPNENIYMLQHFLNNSFENLNYAKLSVASVLLLIVVLVVFAVFYGFVRRKGGVPGMKKSSRISGFFALLLAFISIAPFCYVLILSFLPASGSITFDYYYDVFLGTSQYLLRFWKSLLICLAIVAGQLAVSVMAGYGFAKCDFPGRNVLLFILMILMVLPLQVTLAPNYIMLDKLGLLDTYSALIFPSIFVPLGTFILTQSFKSVSDDIIDAAKLDGCGLFGLLWRIVLPMNTSGLVCVTLLSFLDGWNMVEQPIAYIKDFLRYPISVALAYVPPADPTLQLVCCILVVLPPLFLFTYFNRELVEGIVLAEVK